MIISRPKRKGGNSFLAFAFSFFRGRASGADAGGHSKGGGHGGQDGDDDVDDFLPEFLLVHSFLSYEL